jgi:hypothetical protein
MEYLSKTPILFHLSDILFAFGGGFTLVLWLVILTNLVQPALAGLILWKSWLIKKMSGGTEGAPPDLGSKSLS